MLVPFALAVTVASAKPVATAERNACPATPADPLPWPNRICGALEVSGRTDAGDAVLDPAFDVLAPASALARPVAGTASVTGFSADGRVVFTFPFVAAGPFKLVIPLAPHLAASVVRLALSASGTTTERRAQVVNQEPAAEAIAASDNAVVFAWNARAFPAVRIATAPGEAPLAVLSGNETYQQAGLTTTARRFVVSFSDGVRSVERTVSVFGR